MMTSSGAGLNRTVWSQGFLSFGPRQFEATEICCGNIAVRQALLGSEARGSELDLEVVQGPECSGLGVCEGQGWARKLSRIFCCSGYRNLRCGCEFFASFIGRSYRVDFRVYAGVTHKMLSRGKVVSECSVAGWH